MHNIQIGGDAVLHWAARIGDIAVVEALVQLGADLDVPGTFGALPLNVAAANNENPAMIETLVRAGADINALYSDGGTPLHSAARRNKNPEIIKTLVRLGRGCKRVG